ncbi:urocortin [Solea senegalensis]|uniref:Urocortin n=1 Tax=Solea senegalensis TaxID=28829 RepID=A0AAV6RUM6_SOLSE|nr:UI-like [Solea senegalensis]KAG7509063.1 urocortin [Solea senegalensis]
MVCVCRSIFVHAALLALVVTSQLQSGCIKSLARVCRSLTLTVEAETSKTQAAASNLLNQDMKPLSLLLLLSSVLLSSHLRPAAGRPRALPGWLMDESGHVQAQRLEELLRRVSGVDSSPSSSSTADLLHENILKLLHSRNHPELAHLQPPQEQAQSDNEDLRTAAVAAQLLKRSENPQLSINLTFDMLRDMIHMAEMERLVADNEKMFGDAGK